MCHLVQGIRLSGHGWNWRRFSVFNGSLGEQVNMSSACGQLITPGSLTTWMVLQPCKNKQVKHIYLYIPTCWDICWDTIQNDREKNQKILQSVSPCSRDSPQWSRLELAQVLGLQREPRRTGQHEFCMWSADHSWIPYNMDGPATLQKQTSEAYIFIYPYMLGYMLG